MGILYKTSSQKPEEEIYKAPTIRGNLDVMAQGFKPTPAQAEKGWEGMSKLEKVKAGGQQAIGTALGIQKGISDVGVKDSLVVGTLSDAAESAKLISISNKVKSNTQDYNDEQWLKSYFEKEEAQAEKEEKYGAGYRIGSTLRGSATFMTELFLAGTLAAPTGGQSITSLVASKGLIKLSKEVIKDKVVRKLLMDVAKKKAKSMAGETAIMTALHLPAGTLERMTGTPEFNDKGEFAGLVNDGTPLPEAMLFSATDIMTEVVSERAGEAFSILGAPIKTALLKSAVLKSLVKANPNISPSKIASITKKSGWDGVINEMLEERVGDIMRGGLESVGLGDTPFAMPTIQQLMEELVSFALMGTTIKAAEKVFKGKPKTGEPTTEVGEEQPILTDVEQQKKREEAGDFLKRITEEKPEVGKIAMEGVVRVLKQKDIDSISEIDRKFAVASLNYLKLNAKTEKALEIMDTNIKQLEKGEEIVVEEKEKKEEPEIMKKFSVEEEGVAEGIRTTAKEEITSFAEKISKDISEEGALDTWSELNELSKKIESGKITDEELTEGRAIVAKVKEEVALLPKKEELSKEAALAPNFATFKEHVLAKDFTEKELNQIWNRRGGRKVIVSKKKKIEVTRKKAIAVDNKGRVIDISRKKLKRDYFDKKGVEKLFGSVKLEINPSLANLLAVNVVKEITGSTKTKRVLGETNTKALMIKLSQQHKSKKEVVETSIHEIFHIAATLLGKQSRKVMMDFYKKVEANPEWRAKIFGSEKNFQDYKNHYNNKVKMAEESVAFAMEKDLLVDTKAIQEAKTIFGKIKNLLKKIARIITESYTLAEEQAKIKETFSFIFDPKSTRKFKISPERWLEVLKRREELTEDSKGKEDVKKKVVTEETLVEEAKNFKTADEFVKAQKKQNIYLGKKSKIKKNRIQLDNDYKIDKIKKYSEYASGKTEESNKILIKKLEKDFINKYSNGDIKTGDGLQLFKMMNYNKNIVDEAEQVLKKIEKIEIKNMSGISSRIKLTDFIKKDSDLFKAYPELKNIEIKSYFQNDGFNAGLSDEMDTIYVYNDELISGLKNNFKDVKNHIRHEIQHLIQKKENWEIGTTIEAAGSRNKYLNFFGEVQARDELYKYDNFDDIIFNKKDSKEKIKKYWEQQIKTKSQLTDIWNKANITKGVKQKIVAEETEKVVPKAKLKVAALEAKPAEATLKQDIIEKAKKHHRFVDFVRSLKKNKKGQIIFPKNSNIKNEANLIKFWEDIQNKLELKTTKSVLSEKNKIKTTALWKEAYEMIHKKKAPNSLADMFDKTKVELVKAGSAKSFSVGKLVGRDAEFSRNLKKTATLKQAIAEKIEAVKSRKDKVIENRERDIAQIKYSKKLMAEAFRQKIINKKDAQALAVDYVFSNIPKDSTAARKFVKSIKNIEKSEDVKEIVRRVDAERIRYEKNKLESTIKRLHKLLKHLPVYHQNVIVSAMENLGMEKMTKTMLNTIRRNKNYLDQHVEDMFEVKNALKNMGLNSPRKVSDMKTHELIVTNDILNSFYKLGRQQSSIDKIQYLYETEKAQKAVIKNSKKLSKLPEGNFSSYARTKFKLLDKAKDKLQAFDFNLMPMDNFFDLLDGMQNYLGTNYTIFKKPVDAASRVKGSLLDATIAEFLPIKQGLRIIDKKGEMKAVKKGKALNAENERRIAVYAYSNQKGGTEKLLDYDDKDLVTTDKEGNKVLKKEFRDIKLNPEEEAAYVYMRNAFDNLYGLVASTAKENRGIVLDHIENYFPMYTDFSGSLMEKIDEMKKNKRGKMPHGALEVRKEDVKQNLRLDVFNVFNRAISDSAHYVAYDGVLKRLDKIAHVKGYKDKIGDRAHKVIVDWLSLLKRNGRATSPDSALMRGSQNLGTFILGYRVATMLKQPLALLDGAGEIGHYAFKYAVQSTSKKWQIFMNTASTEYYNRSGGDPGIMMSEGGKITKKIKENSFKGLVYIDRYTAGAVWFGAYNKKMDEMGKKVDINEINQKAVAYADLVMRKTQATADFKDLPPAYNNEYREWAHSGLKFQNFMITSRWGTIRHSFASDFKHNKPKAIARAMFIATSITMEIAITNAMFNLKNLVTGEDDEDRYRGFLEGLWMTPFDQIPILGTLTNSIEYSSTGVPIADTWDKITDAGNSIITSKRMDTKLIHSINLVAMTLGVTMGMPLDEARGIIVKSLKNN